MAKPGGELALSALSFNQGREALVRVSSFTRRDDEYKHPVKPDDRTLAEPRTR